MSCIRVLGELRAHFTINIAVDIGAIVFLLGFGRGDRHQNFLVLVEFEKTNRRHKEKEATRKS